MKITRLICILMFTAGVGFVAHAEETVGEKAAATATKAKNTTKEIYRNSKDELCELINGQMKCVAQKVKHKAQNMTDAAGAKAKEVKNKVD